MPVPRLFAHLLTADGDEAVHVDAVRHLVARELSICRPEQHVEVDDVLPMKWICSVFGSARSWPTSASRRCGLPCRCRSSFSVKPGSRPAHPARRRSTCPAHRGSGCRNTAHHEMSQSPSLPSSPSHSLVLAMISLCSRFLPCVQPFGPAAQNSTHCGSDSLKKKCPKNAFPASRRERGVRILEVRRRVHRAAVFAGVAVLVFVRHFGHSPLM